MKEHTYIYKQEFPLELGGSLPGVEIHYATLGELNSQRNNVVWVCHALTANANCSEWWEGMIEQLYDPKEYFIICANVLGGCYGSTGPLSINPVTSEPYYYDFPDITNRDLVAFMKLLKDHLEIGQIDTLIGASLGGQYALEWAVIEPDTIRHLVTLATNAQHAPWGIAFNESQRMAISLDPTWGDRDPKAGTEGMKTARAIALLSYRNYITYQMTQSEEHHEVIDAFKASSYQVYQGEKLAQRFNAFTYWYLSKTMDSHNLGRGRGSHMEALQAIRAQTTVIGIRTDVLFPLTEQRFLALHIPNAKYYEIDSNYGHDGFLIEKEQLRSILGKQRFTSSSYSRYAGL